MSIDIAHRGVRRLPPVSRAAFQSPLDGERALVTWIEGATEDDCHAALEILAGVRRRHHKDETAAARRLELRVERRLGELLGPAMTPRQAGSMRGVALPDAERKANSRARALAAIPRDVFEDELRRPKPSMRRLLGR